MDFRILGPLEVWEYGALVSLGGTRERSLVAALVVSANRVLSSERLIQILWGDEPPETAANTLQVYVSHIRRSLEPARERRGAGEMVLTRPPGYQLSIPAGSVDAARFERGADEGGRMVATRPADAVEVLRSALGEWRGPALAEFLSMPFALAEAERLEERRLVAIEQRLEADLALGHHQACAAELESLVREHPVRERLVAQQMLALYRSGRQADALKSCSELRGRLRDELGIDPSPEIRALERAILVQDPSLLAPTGWGGPGAPGSRALPVGSGAMLELSAGSGRQLVPLTGERVTLGRDPANDIVLQGDGTVSRRHAEILREDVEWRLRDLGSANGTYVNGEPASGDVRLRDGDEIRFGQARVRFRVAGSDTSTVPYTPGS